MLDVGPTGHDAEAGHVGQVRVLAQSEVMIASGAHIIFLLQQYRFAQKFIITLFSHTIEKSPYILTHLPSVQLWPYFFAIQPLFEKNHVCPLGRLNYVLDPLLDVIGHGEVVTRLGAMVVLASVAASSAAETLALQVTALSLVTSTSRPMASSKG